MFVKWVARRDRTRKERQNTQGHHVCKVGSKERQNTQGHHVCKVSSKERQNTQGETEHAMTSCL